MGKSPESYDNYPSLICYTELLLGAEYGYVNTRLCVGVILSLLGISDSHLSLMMDS
jgi:hypothetical protein